MSTFKANAFLLKNLLDSIEGDCHNTKYYGSSRVTFRWPDGTSGGGYNTGPIRTISC